MTEVPDRVLNFGSDGEFAPEDENKLTADNLETHADKLPRTYGIQNVNSALRA